MLCFVLLIFKCLRYRGHFIEQMRENSVLVIIPTYTDLSGCLRASQVCMNSKALGYIKYGMLLADDWNQTSCR